MAFEMNNLKSGYANVKCDMMPALAVAGMTALLTMCISCGSAKPVSSSAHASGGESSADSSTRTGEGDVSMASRRASRCAEVPVIEGEAINKLGPGLDMELQMWRHRGCSPRSELLAVHVKYRGEVALLREAGLRTSLDRNNIVSGRIAPRDVGRLAALPSVDYIWVEPRVEPG